MHKNKWNNEYKGGVTIGTNEGREAVEWPQILFININQNNPCPSL